MKSRIISLVIFALCLMPHWAKAQITASNPLEWMALAEGNEVINDQIEKQINGQTKTAMLQNSIAAEFNRIHKWEKQYNSYLKTVSGYASSLKQPAGHHRLHEHEQSVYRDGNGTGIGLHAPE